MTFRLSAVLGAASCAVLLAASSAAADGQASFAVKPVTYDPALPATKSYFIVRAVPGQAIADKVRIVNTGAAAGTAYLYAVDATTGQTSGAVYLARDKARRDVGAWTRLDRTQVTLAPGEQAIVPFTIRVPRSVRTGDHLGGIVAENAAIQGSTGRGALQIRIKHLTIAAVELQLPGRPAARVVPTGVEAGGQHGWQYVYVHLVSRGTVMVKPQGRLVVTDVDGRRVASRDLQLDTFLPRTAIDYPVLLPRKTLGPGTYTASVTIGSSNRMIAGYRPGASTPFMVTRSFQFTVSSGQEKRIYAGVAPVAAPLREASAGQGRFGTSTIGLLVVAPALLLLLAFVAWIAVKRRRSARTSANVETRVSAAGPGTPAVEPGGSRSRTR